MRVVDDGVRADNRQIPRPVSDIPCIDGPDRWWHNGRYICFSQACMRRCPAGMGSQEMCRTSLQCRRKPETRLLSVPSFRFFE